MPKSVVLKTTPRTDAAAVSASFGCSRAVLSYWRKAYNFPSGVRSKNTTVTVTADIAAWCHRQGINVIWT
jgi:hypothetical protein